MALFTDTEIQKIAFSAVIDDGRRTFERGRVSGLQFEGNDIIASVKEGQTHRVVISSDNSGIRFDCSCGFSFGGACEHVIAAMLAVNANQAIQVGIDWTANEPANDGENCENIDDGEDITEDNSVSVIDISNEKPSGRLYLIERESMLLAELRFAYFNGTAEFTRTDRSQNRLVPLENGTVYRIHRSRARETSITAMLAQYELMPYQTAFYTPCCDSRIWILQELPRLALEGFEIYGHDKLKSANARQSTPKLSISISSKENIFDCEVNVSFDGISATLAALISAVRHNSSFILLSDGTSGIMPQEWLEKFAGLFAALEADPSAMSIKIKQSHLALANILLDMADEKKTDVNLRKNAIFFKTFRVSCEKNRQRTSPLLCAHISLPGTNGSIF